MASQRNVVIDIAKGIGISLVVFGHLRDFGVSQIGIVHSMVYLFHVSVFFFLSGIFFRSDKPVWQFVEDKFKRLYIPFILANMLYWILEMVGGKTFAFTELLKIMFGLSTIPSAGPTWFLVVLFRVTVVYKLMDWLCRHNMVALTVLSCALLIASRYLTGQYWIAQTFVALFFYHIGHMAYPKIGLLSKPVRPAYLLLYCAVSCAALWFLAKWNGLVLFVWGMYGHFVLFLIGSAVGILLILAVSKALSLHDGIARFFSEVGKCTLPILVLHFLPFWVLTELRDRIGSGIPQICWALACLVSGIVVPLILVRLKNRIIEKK